MLSAIAHLPDNNARGVDDLAPLSGNRALHLPLKMPLAVIGRDSRHSRTQPAVTRTDDLASAPKVSPDGRPETPTSSTSTVNNSAKLISIRELLEQRNGRKRPDVVMRSPNNDGDSREQLIRDLLAKRGSLTMSSTTPEVDSNAPITPNEDTPQPKKRLDNSALSALLAQRAGSTQTSNQTVEVSAPTSRPERQRDTTALSAMLSQRSNQTLAEQSVTNDPVKPRNAVADMLSRRAAATSQVSSATSHPVAAMLAKRTAPTELPARPANPIAEMLAKRQSAAEKSIPESKETENPQEPGDEYENVALREHPKYGSYFKMLKIGHPPEVVKHRMRKEGVDPFILDCDPSKPLPKTPVPSGPSIEVTQEDKEFQAALKLYNEKMPRFQQMMKMGLPRGAVEHKMRMEGVDVAWLDAPPQRAVKTQPSGPTEAEIAAHRQKYAQYFQMLKMGLPRGAVEHKMRMSGVDPRELDGPFVSSSGPSGQSDGRKAPAPVKRANSIRKKLHWEVKRQESRTMSRESLWNCSISEDTVSQVRISEASRKLLEELFVKEVTNSKASAAKGAGKGGAKGRGGWGTAQKQVMYLIDMKKSQNIAITLARIKLSYPELKREILALNPTVLSTAQLQALMDMWPDQQEQVAIDNFHGDDSMIGAAEKFLVETRNIPRFREKLGCLVFKQEFPNRVHELRESINLVIRGVNQVCCSTALRQLFIYILQTGNLLNFGGDEDRAAGVAGFSLNSLVKLSQTKAFVGGITFLQYVVQSIDRDIPQLARFPRQINLIHKCSKVSISSMFAEKRALEEGLKSLHHEAQAVIPAEGDADAELAATILKHFAMEVEREVEALEVLLDQLIDSKERFLEYFEEEETSEELDVLLSHISNFTAEFEREHDKYMETKKKKELQEMKEHQEKQHKHTHAKPHRQHHENPLHAHHQHRPTHPPTHHPHRHLHHANEGSSGDHDTDPKRDARVPVSKAAQVQQHHSTTGRSDQRYLPQFIAGRLKKHKAGDSDVGSAASNASTMSA
ncbi:hypothetical protein PINS_up019651 [Pythium insidiosum]|nr:hypothetical protein PINS_up019651 [Pythium insidiosum]